MACLRGLEGGGGVCNLGGIVYINKAENHIHYSFYMENLVESCLKILFLNMGVFRGSQKGTSVGGFHLVGEQNFRKANNQVYSSFQLETKYKPRYTHQLLWQGVSM